jgi:hypothetical protein
MNAKGRNFEYFPCSKVKNFDLSAFCGFVAFGDSKVHFCTLELGSVRLIRTFLQRLPKRCENDRSALLGQTV